MSPSDGHKVGIEQRAWREIKKIFDDRSKGFRHQELSRLRRDFSDRIDRINKINIILLFPLYLPAGRQVLNIVSILSKKWDFLYYELSRLRRNFFDRINTINKIFFIS